METEWKKERTLFLVFTILNYISLGKIKWFGNWASRTEKSQQGDGKKAKWFREVI